jgi:hypothetical protein
MMTAAGKPPASGGSGSAPSSLDSELRFDVVDPKPDAIAESLRAFGYSLADAVADLVDNSLSARSKHVKLTFWWDGPSSWIRVEDDGRGMKEAELVEAMRVGTRNPREVRDPTDLGRFGLGLKTASFSQCRCVLVRSRAIGSAEATRCWDLDVIQQTKKWALLHSVPDSRGEATLGHVPEAASGTIVLWQRMDRVVSDSPTADRAAQAAFLASAREVGTHLGMVFHRFLSGRDSVEITINGPARVEPWDPFLETDPSTQPLPPETFGSGDRAVTVRPFVLPHQSRIAETTFESASGPRGWNAQQGFYIYRNRRLIVPGGWLGMYHQEEHYKLARIEVDIGNALDAEWHIDVRKARARPPDQLKRELRRIADATRKLAVEVYRHRGKALQRQGAGTDQVFVWMMELRGKRTVYRINRNHPLIKRLMNGHPPGEPEIKMALRLIEESIPVPHILGAFAENANRRDRPFEGSGKELDEMLKEAIRVLSASGLQGADLKRALLALEPFQDHPEMVEAVVREVRSDN